MRQLKNFMKAKKPMWNCGECKCITLQCWRENDEFCNCGTSSEGLGVEYKFKNWDGRILKQWSIEEWATPTPPADPTREATAEYTYTFAGWDPEVGPISEDTIYTATYTATVNEYTVTWVDWDGNTLDTDTLEYGALPRYEWATPTKTATAEYTYTFSGWSPEITPVTWNVTYTAQFEATPRNYTVTIGVSPEWAGTVDTQQVTVAYGTEISSSNNVLTIGSNTITATAWSGYGFSSWGTLPATVTEDLTITATFEATAP